jgi:hypothetical protein
MREYRTSVRATCIIPRICGVKTLKFILPGVFCWINPQNPGKYRQILQGKMKIGVLSGNAAHDHPLQRVYPARMLSYVAGNYGKD